MADSAQIEQCKKEVAELKLQIEQKRGDPKKAPLKEQTKKQGLNDVAFPTLKQKRILKGHFGKIYALHWAKDSRHLVSASQDGKLIIWNGFTTNKVHAIPLRSAWVMTCAYSPGGQLVACGGLDNLCSVFKLPEAQRDGNPSQKTYAELAMHEGYLSCCRFIRDSEIITSSGDSSCILWDVEAKTHKALFNDHTGDVMSVDIFDSTGVFISGSCDATAKLWDYRAGKHCMKTFHGHESDINSVKFFPDGNAFGTGSDDSSCRLFDIRAYDQLNEYSDPKILCGITSVCFSLTGNKLCAGYDDFNCYVWDTLSGTLVDQLMGHDNRVSCIGVSEDGKALATGSWDTTCQIWA